MSERLFWEDALENHILLHHVVLLYGNLHDVFPDAQGRPRDLREVVIEAAARAGFPEVRALGFDACGAMAGVPRLDDFRVEPEDEPTCWVLGNVQALFPNVAQWSVQDWEQHDHLVRRLHASRGRHRFVLTFPDEGRIPGNFLSSQPGVVRYAVPLPELPDRRRWAGGRLAVRFQGAWGEPDQAALGRFAGGTEGLHWMDLESIARRTDLDVETRPEALVRRFKFGDSRDYWGELRGRRDALMDAPRAFVDPAGADPLLGQDEAVDKALRVVMKACGGLADVTSPGYNRPRGVLFFVGPTGVGKTMLAKKLAGLVFGSEESCLVFDMSEYSTPQAEARLVGAPPGYVGYDAGGQLTAAVRQRPFSVILFDEIDKADPAILTKFLQILDEGRLTDGKGQTCYFSDALIVFTSNAGAMALPPEPVEPGAVHRGSPYRELRTYYVDSLRQSGQFAERPEILNRVGLSNVVPFRHVGDCGLVEDMVRGIVRRLRERFEDQDVALELSPDDEAAIVTHVADSAAWVEFGMRNVRQTFETEVVEPLSEAMIANVDKRTLRLRLDAGRVRVSPD